MPSTLSQPPSPLPPPTAPMLAIPTDFPDWLSPMVVKEVRQNLRGWLFMSLFILLHGTLLLWSLFAANDTYSGYRRSGSDSLFWWILIIGIGVIVSRGMGALYNERHDNTFELLRLTGLSAWRIVAGKWVAVVVQLGLFLASLLPYGVLRYYFGTLNATSDAVLLALLVSLALALSALAVYLSCLKRWLAWTIWGVMLFLIAWLLALLTRGWRADFVPAEKLVLSGVAVLLSFYAVVFLLQGASVIASSSENFSTLKRLVGWSAFIPVCAVFFFQHEAAFALLWVFVTPLMAFVIADALTACSARRTFVVRRFIRWRWAGRCAAFIFGPNRAAGLFYAVLTGAVFIGIGLCIFHASGTRIRSDDVKPFYAFAATSGAVGFLAAGLAGLTPRKWAEHYAAHFWAFLLLLIFGGAAAALIGLEMENKENALRYWSMLSPAGALVNYVEDRQFRDLATLATIGHWIVALVLLVLPTVRESRLLWRLLNGEEQDESRE